jgi:thermitase
VPIPGGVRVGFSARTALALAVVAAVASSASALGKIAPIGVAAVQPVDVLRVACCHRGSATTLRSKTHRKLASAHSAKRIQPTTRPPRTPAPAPVPQLVVPTDPAFSQQWGLSMIGAPAAWQVSQGVKPVVVAVVDSGVDPTQPDLQGALVPGADFVDSSGDTSDGFGHGTMVAGVIAARPDNGVGGAGICWTCFVMPIKVLDSNGAGTASAIADGIRWAADHGANVISMSFVLTGPDAGVESAIAYAHDHGVLVVAAAGNNGDDTPTYPASYPDVVSVAAIDQSSALYSWSTHGTWVTLAAPGCTVTTALGGQFGTFCGTSEAAPLVAGLAGLALSAGNGSASDVEAALEQTADPLPGLVGSGRIDADRLLHQATGR